MSGEWGAASGGESRQSTISPATSQCAEKQSKLHSIPSQMDGRARQSVPGASLHRDKAIAIEFTQN